MPLESIAKSFGTAVLWWAGVYLVVVHIFVVWKWESYSVSPRLKMMNQTVSEVVTVTIDETELWTKIIATTQASLTGTATDIEMIQAKQAQLQQSLEDMTIALDNVTEKRKILMQMEKELSPLSEHLVVFRDGTVEPDPSLFHLDHFASLSDLGEISVLEDLKQAFWLVTEALESHVEKARSLRWAAVNKLLQGDFPERLSDVSACPFIPVDDDENDDDAGVERVIVEKRESDSSEPEVPVITEDDVAARQNEIRAMWAQVYEDKPLPVTDAEIARLEGVRQKLADQWISRVEKSLDEALTKLEKAMAAALEAEPEEDERKESDGEENVHCAKTDNVLAVLEAGIEAMHRKQGLREALHKAMVARDADLSDEILDADLPLKEVRPEIRGPLTLRQYLDVAILTHSVPGWINSWVDLVSGYNDAFDSWIDTLPDNLGDVAVQNILKGAGNVDIGKVQRAFHDVEDKLSNF